jgi:hypothetical protein
MPGSPDRETPIPVRRFNGVMLALDPAFVPIGFLTQCDGWIPALTYTLTKRLGSKTWQTLSGAGAVDPFVYTTDSAGNRYLYCVAGNQLYVSTNDSPFTAVSSGNFATASPRYGVAVLGDTLYCGNDSDPIKLVPLGGTAQDLTQLAVADDTGQSGVNVDDPNSNLVAGTYSYRWGRYNSSTQRWTALGPVRTVTTGATSRQRFTFRAPTVAPPANELWHLFVAGADQEIEGACDQTPNGLPISSGTDQFSLLDQPNVEGTPVPIPSTVTRRGSHLVAHRGCLWGAGGVGNPRQRVWQSSVVVPGLEQTLFNQGTFFPASAITRDIGDPVTGLTPIPQTSGLMQPTSPLAIFTAFGTWLFQGDLVGDPNASLTQISGQIGCPSDRTIAATRAGVMFAGKYSVYLIAPATQEPKDVGWPIEPALRAVPSALRSACWAVYHRGFYKLALVPPGGTTATQQWWLDLRRGLGDPPNWWGPHTTQPYTAAAVARNHPAEDDRLWGVQGNPGQVLLLDQAGSYIHDGAPPVPIVSRWMTGYLDAGAPLTPKLAKRARVVAQAYGPTSLGVTVSGDQALSTSGVLPLPVSTGALWETSDWDVSDWTVLALTLAEFECPVPEVRARAFQVSLSHSDAMQVDLRDFELRVQPSARETM